MKNITKLLFVSAITFAELSQQKHHHHHHHHIEEEVMAETGAEDQALQQTENRVYGRDADGKYKNHDNYMQVRSDLNE